MTNDVPKHVQWLNKEGYQLDTSLPFESGTVSWSRKTRYGAPRCTTNGELIVTVTKIGETFAMSVRASTLNYWGSVEVYDLTEDYLVARGRQIKHRIVDAWRELSA